VTPKGRIYADEHSDRLKSTHHNMCYFTTATKIFEYSFFQDPKVGSGDKKAGNLNAIQMKILFFFNSRLLNISRQIFDDFKGRQSINFSCQSSKF
jgi:hypothetical protein